MNLTDVQDIEINSTILELVEVHLPDTSESQ